MTVKKSLLTAVLLLATASSALAGCGPAGSTPTNTSAAPNATEETAKAATITHVTPQQAAKMLKDGAAMIDVREPDEWAQVRVEKSTLIPLGEVKADPKKAAVAPKVLLMCRSGKRATAAAEAVQSQKNIELFVIDGGIIGWENAGLPVQKGEPQKQ